MRFRPRISHKAEFGHEKAVQGVKATRTAFLATPYSAELINF